jgi:hypothetical protein
VAERLCAVRARRAVAVAFPARGRVAALALLTLMSPAAMAGAATFTAGPPAAIWTLQDRQATGLFFFPDMPIGVIKGAQGQYLIFAPGTGRGAKGVPNGTYECAGTLARFAPAKKGPNGPLPSMKLGRLQPSPDHTDFDRDYAGGGPLFFVDAGGRKPLLISVYHGEYHADEPKVPPAYGGTGLAVSEDYGASFVKLGEILSPHATRAESTARKQNVFADGNLIEADADGNVPGTESAGSGRDTYYYSVFSDRQSMTERQGFAIARVKKRGPYKGAA